MERNDTSLHWFGRPLSNTRTHTYHSPTFTLIYSHVVTPHTHYFELYTQTTIKYYLIISPRRARGVYGDRARGNAYEKNVGNLGIDKDFTAIFKYDWSSSSVFEQRCLLSSHYLLLLLLPVPSHTIQVWNWEVVLQFYIYSPIIPLLPSVSVLLLYQTRQTDGRRTDRVSLSYSLCFYCLLYHRIVETHIHSHGFCSFGRIDMSTGNSFFLTYVAGWDLKRYEKLMVKAPDCPFS